MIAALAIVASVAHAQTTPTTPTEPTTSDRLSLRVEGGVAIPITPSAFPDGWGLGFGVATGLDYDWKPGLQLTGDVSYYHFSNDLSGQSSGGSNLSGNSIWTMSFLGGIRMQSKEDNPVVPFVHASAGLAIASLTGISVSGSFSGNIPSETDVALTLELNAGAHYHPVGSNIGYVFDVGWQPVFVSGETLSYIPIRFGIEF